MQCVMLKINKSQHGNSYCHYRGHKLTRLGALVVTQDCRYMEEAISLGASVGNAPFFSSSRPSSN